MKYTQQSKLVREARLSMGMTQVELSNKLGYTGNQVFVCRMEKGNAGVPVHMIKTICKLLRIPKRIMIQAKADDYKSRLRVLLK